MALSRPVSAGASHVSSVVAYAVHVRVAFVVSWHPWCSCSRSVCPSAPPLLTVIIHSDGPDKTILVKKVALEGCILDKYALQSRAVTRPVIAFQTT